MISTRIKRHRAQRHHGGSHMVLVPFIDMLMMLVVFLLAHSSEVDILPNTKNIQIPQSIAELKPRPTVVVMITREQVLVNGRTVANIADIMRGDAVVIEPLKAALQGLSDPILRDAARENLAEREITIMGDRTLPYAVLKRVMATCTDANYGKVSLAVSALEQNVEAGA
jgi:biopolymer transport protein ExbD